MSFDTEIIRLTGLFCESVDDMGEMLATACNEIDSLRTTLAATEGRLVEADQESERWNQECTRLRDLLVATQEERDNQKVLDQSLREILQEERIKLYAAEAACRAARGWLSAVKHRGFLENDWIACEAYRRIVEGTP